MDVTCPNCGASNRSTSRFCARCGHDLHPTQNHEATSNNEPQSVDLPWLQGVQDRAVLPTDRLKADNLAQTPPTPSIPSIPFTSSTPPTASPGEQPATQQPTEPATTEEPPRTAPPDEAPPPWVVSILEPSVAPPPNVESYEPEEMAHIMPWTAGAPAEEGEAQPPGNPSLPPWLSDITVQETLQGSPTSAEETLPNAADLGLEDIEPFTPPDTEDEAPVAPAPPQEQEPHWLRSLRPPEEAAPQHLPLTRQANQPPQASSEPSPTETLVEPIARGLSVRPPRAGAVETLAALMQPSAETARRVLPDALVLPGATPNAAPTPTHVSAVRPNAARSWLFPDGIIYLVILAALLAVLIIRPPFGNVDAPAARGAQQFYNAIEAVPTNKPVLVVYDWEASRSAEMSLLSEAVIQHLMARRIRFVTVSTVPQGPGFAQQTTDAVKSSYGYEYGRDYLILGYLPGNEAALTSLMSDFNNLLPLDYVNSRNVSDTELARSTKISSMGDFSMIIDLASEEAELRNWIEQVSTRTGLPIIAAVPQGLEPIARPYENVPGAGIKALISGPTGAMQYSQELARGRGAALLNSDTISNRLNTQSVAQLLVALVIIAALITTGTKRALRR
ncbi:MAG: zinc-ribbon domain-containing protein [Chloroflexi bacterium]|nr:zinc-ribbon domain-containing protein [Chloroflexota bacterium]